MTTRGMTAMALIALGLVAWADTAGWRGDGTGVFRDTKAVATWDVKTGANVRWSVPLPARGTAQPVVVGDRVIVACEPDRVLCLDATTGKQRWEQTVSPLSLLEPEKAKAAREKFLEGWTGIMRDDPYDISKGPSVTLITDQAKRERCAALWNELKPLGLIPPRWCESGYLTPTPITDGTVIVVRHMSDLLACLDMDGTIKWTARPSGGKLSRDNIVETPSPALIGDRVICTYTPSTKVTKVDSAVANEALVAYDKATGKELWRSGLFRTAGWLCATPAVLRVGGRNLIVTGGGAVVDAETGDVLAEKTGWCGSACSPVTWNGDTVCFMEIESHGMGKPAEYIIPRGARTYAVQYAFTDGKLTWKELWRHEYSFEIRCFGTPVCVAGLLYIGGDWGTLIDAATGEILAGDPKDRKTKRSPLRVGGLGEYAGPTAAGGYVFQPWMKGSVRVFAVGRDLKQVAEVAGVPGDHCLSAPAFAHDRMYLRTDRVLYCIGATP